MINSHNQHPCQTVQVSPFMMNTTRGIAWCVAKHIQDKIEILGKHNALKS